jgi:hypothetical protein
MGSSFSSEFLIQLSLREWPNQSIEPGRPRECGEAEEARGAGGAQVVGVEGDGPEGG